MEKIKEAKFIILVLNFILLFEPMSLRRIRDIESYPAIHLDKKIIYDDLILEIKINEKVSDLITYIFHLEKEEVLYEIGRIIYTLLYTELIQDQINLFTSELLQKKGLLFEKDVRELRIWIENMYDDLLKLKVVNKMIEKLNSLKTGASQGQFQYLEELIKVIKAKFLSLHPRNPNPKFLSEKNLELIKEMVKSTELIPQTFASLLKKEGIKPEQVLSIYIIPFSRALKDEPAKFVWRFKVTIDLDEELYSTEFILKLVTPPPGTDSPAEYIEGIGEKIEAIIGGNLGDNVAVAGFWHKIEDQTEPKLIFTQKSYLGEKFSPLSEFLSDKRFELEVKAVEAYIKVWKEIKNKDGEGLLIKPGLNYVVIWEKNATLEVTLLNIEYSSWLSDKKKIYLELKNAGFDERAIEVGILNALGKVEGLEFLEEARQ